MIFNFIKSLFGPLFKGSLHKKQERMQTDFQNKLERK